MMMRVEKERGNIFMEKIFFPQSVGKLLPSSQYLSYPEVVGRTMWDQPRYGHHHKRFPYLKNFGHMSRPAIPKKGRPSLKVNWKLEQEKMAANYAQLFASFLKCFVKH